MKNKIFSEQNTDLFNFPAAIEQQTVLPDVARGQNGKAGAYWSKCLNIIQDNVSSQVFKTWFEQIKPLQWENNQLTIQVPSQFFYEWIEEHYYSLLQKTVLEVMGAGAKLQYQVIVEEIEDKSQESRTIKLPAFKHPPAPEQTMINFNEPTFQVQDFPTFLNNRYTFDNFIAGESNQLAKSAAMAIANNPGGTRYNPLFVYGDTGLGKTHLIQAIGNEIIRGNGHKRVLYSNSERFTMEFINAIQNNKSNEFVNFYRSIDVLLLDDIQFFGGKEKTQDNFFHTFNALHQAGKQLVLTSDKPPRDLKDVDERLISRFQWGLTVDIQAPDLEMRMAILQKKSADEGIELPTETIEFLARNVKSSIRELEGTLISLLAKVMLDRRELNLDLAREIIYGISIRDPKPLTIDDIIEIVAKYYKLPPELLISKSRKHEVALARQMSMYLSKQLISLSLKNIGEHFGGRDHSTVMHSCHTIQNYLSTDKTVKIAYDSLVEKIRKM
ncbi:MAG: chromosomal replication initiation protein [Ignavibacteria bacterium]|nr:chromosomal replication initiation protein [Ignavibacteria bacterium]